MSDPSAEAHQCEGGSESRDISFPAFAAAQAGLLATRYVSDVETGQKVVGAFELTEWADAIGFDAAEAMRRIAKVRR